MGTANFKLFFGHKNGEEGTGTSRVLPRPKGAVLIQTLRYIPMVSAGEIYFNYNNYYSVRG